ncbi:metallophosphoesterase family protein [Pseudobdellovibrio exovorus]|uniref:Calcineurin-like phosphoesterase domain-containing protein n=1 Tax=Pseudobdellovibrio exovorus JSS TaxID=1184267 RepID=M4VBC9_9BACT|nr:metallophosphoesterase [Pseudobdellovibrio exovorus]AGH96702.1 hypothetical protein A11Q_2486 [Pseudobdellovibrio exovorus JSS]
MKAKAVVFGVIVLSFLTFSLVGIGCGKYRGSPFSSDILRGERDLNLSAVASLGDPEADGIIRIAIIADPHQNYKDLEDAISTLKRVTDVDFLVNLGDITNSSYNMEYDQYLRSHSLIGVPSFVVAGNHDMLGAGPAIFNKVFGTSNLFFETNSYRFILFNSANLETPENFHPDWLLSIVQASTKPVMIFSHIPLDDKERFHGDVKAKFTQIVQDSRVKAVMNGHNHAYLLRYDSGTVLLQVPRVEGNQWVVLEVQAGQYQIINQAGVVVPWQNFKP